MPTPGRRPSPPAPPPRTPVRRRRRRRRLVFVEGDSTRRRSTRSAAFLVDPLLQTGSWDVPDRPHGIEITLHPGVTDAAADAVRHAADQLGIAVAAAATGRRIEFPPTGAADRRRCCAAWSPTRSSSAGRPARPTPTCHPGADDVPAVEVDRRPRPRRRRRWPRSARALARPRPRRAARHPRPLRGAGPRPHRRRARDAAQTWSEHCAHKTFRAAIIARPTATRVEPLLRQLRDATDADRRPVRALGVRRQRRHRRVRRRARRSPSRPRRTTTRRRSSRSAAPTPASAASSATCWAPPTARSPSPTSCASARPTCPSPTLPDGVLHPRRIRDGVVAGVADYGNKIGLPTVAGAVLYDPGYTANPLVFCGCIGVAADRPRADRPAPGRPGRRARRPHRPRRHPRRDVLAAPRWTPPPARSPAPACRSATRSSRSCSSTCSPAPTTCTRRSPTAAPAGCRRRSARWPRASAPTSTWRSPR